MHTRAVSEGTCRGDLARNGSVRRRTSALPYFSKEARFKQEFGKKGTTLPDSFCASALRTFARRSGLYGNLFVDFLLRVFVGHQQRFNLP